MQTNPDASQVPAGSTAGRNNHHVEIKAGGVDSSPVSHQGPLSLAAVPLSDSSPTSSAGQLTPRPATTSTGNALDSQIDPTFVGPQEPLKPGAVAKIMAEYAQLPGQAAQVPLNRDSREGLVEVAADAIVASSGVKQPDGRKSFSAAQSNITNINPSPTFRRFIAGALESDAARSFPGEAELMNAFARPDIRQKLEQKPTFIVAPLTTREVDEATVLKGVAREHCRLIAQSGGKLQIVLVYNDYKATTPEEAQAGYEKFQAFVKENYYDQKLKDPVTGEAVNIRASVSAISLNSAVVQERLRAAGKSEVVNRATPGKGNAVALGVHYALERGAKNVAFHDTDICTFEKTPIIQALVLPLLNGTHDIAKLSFTRYADGRLNGRLTRGFSAPILKAIEDHTFRKVSEAAHRESTEGAAEPVASVIRDHLIARNLAAFRYPFSGEIGFTREAVLSAPFHPTFGLESEHLHHAAKGRGAVNEPLRVGDVMVSAYDHMHSPVGVDATVQVGHNAAPAAGKSTGLHKMLEDTFDGLIVPLLRSGMLTTKDFGSVEDPGSILGLANAHLTRTLTDMAKDVNHYIIETLKSHSNYSEEYHAIFRNEVKAAICESTSHKERASININGKDEPATEQNRLHALDAVRVNLFENIPRSVFLAQRLSFQLEHELSSRPEFLDHCARLIEEYAEKSVGKDTRALPPIGHEIKGWHLSADQILAIVPQTTLAKAAA